MVFRYIEGFDSLATTTNVQEDGWRSTRIGGAIVDTQFGFAPGRLNARSFGNRRQIITEGLSRPIPTGMDLNIHVGFAYRFEFFSSPSTFRQESNNLICLSQTTSTNATQPTVVWTFQQQARLFHITVNERTGTGPTPVQQTVTVPAPDWLNLETWNYYEFISSNNGTEFYGFVNGAPVISYINAAIPYQSSQFTLVTFGVFQDIAQWNFPVNSTGVGNSDLSNDQSIWYLDDIFIRDSTGAVPMGDFRMNDGVGVTDFSVEFTPTVGSTSNFSNIDEEIPDGDITVVSANSAPRTDLYTHNATTSAVVIPATLVLKTRVTAKNGVAAPVAFSGLISDGLITREGGPYNITTQYTNQSLFYNTSPTNVQWTKSTIENVIVGFTNKVV